MELEVEPLIMTVGLPGGMILPIGLGMEPHRWCVCREIIDSAAGMLLIMTAIEPFAIIPGPPGTQPGSMQGADLQVAVAAGLLPIMTVGLPSMIANGSPGCGTGVGTGAGGEWGVAMWGVLLHHVARGCWWHLNSNSNGLASQMTLPSTRTSSWLVASAPDGSRWSERHQNGCVQILRR